MDAVAAAFDAFTNRDHGITKDVTARFLLSTALVIALYRPLGRSMALIFLLVSWIPSNLLPGSFAPLDLLPGFILYIFLLLWWVP